MIKFILNRFGLYTVDQYAEQVKLADKLSEYSKILEKAIDGMSDPLTPILVLGSNITVENVSLRPRQIIIVSPHARNIRISNVFTEYKENV